MAEKSQVKKSKIFIFANALINKTNSLLIILLNIALFYVRLKHIGAS